MSANGARAAARRVQLNTPSATGLGSMGDALAVSVAQGVARALGPMLAQLVPQKTACLYCAARRKIAQAAYTTALAEARKEHEIACNAAAELGNAAPEWSEPDPPSLPEVQEAFTWVPVQPVAGGAPVTIPVCYDDLPDQPGDAQATVPAYRDAGLVTGDGRAVIVQG